MPNISKQPLYFLAAIVFLIVGLLARWAGAGTQLWLDEIFSLRLVESFSSPWSVFQNLSDNNHYLNSLFLYAVGVGADPFVYRSLSLVFSILTLALAVGLQFREGKEQGFIATILFSLSYVLVLYGTEARGYSAVLFFSLLSFVVARRYVRNTIKAKKYNGCFEMFGMSITLRAILVCTLGRRKAWKTRLAS